MRKKYLVLFLILIVLIGASCKKENEAEPLDLEEIIEEGALIRDELRLDVDNDGEKETLVVYVLESQIEKDEDMWCGNLSGEKLLGKFYFGLVDDNKLESKIELLMDSLENGGEYQDKAIIVPQDLNGDNNELEFVFESYASCNGNFMEIIGIEEGELTRYSFYTPEAIIDELFVSSSELKFQDGYLVQEYYVNLPDGSGTFQNYYSFSKEKKGFDFVKEVKVSD